MTLFQCGSVLCWLIDSDLEHRYILDVERIREGGAFHFSWWCWLASGCSIQQPPMRACVLRVRSRLVYKYRGWTGYFFVPCSPLAACASRYFSSDVRYTKLPASVYFDKSTPQQSTYIHFAENVSSYSIPSTAPDN